MTAKGLTKNTLIDAIRANNLSGVLSALGDGFDVNLPDVHGCSGLPLRTACFEGNLAIVRELLNRGANPNAAASDGPGAPLRLALRNGHQDVADLLLQNGALPSGDTTIPAETLREAEAPGSFGTDTNLLSMDLLFLDENEDSDASPKVSDKR